jgi:hypothetical protein
MELTERRAQVGSDGKIKYGVIISKVLYDLTQLYTLLVLIRKNTWSRQPAGPAPSQYMKKAEKKPAGLIREPPCCTQVDTILLSVANEPSGECALTRSVNSLSTSVTSTDAFFDCCQNIVSFFLCEMLD